MATHLVKKCHDKEDPVKVIECYTNAVKTIDPLKAVGKPHTIWVDFAKYYESHNSLDNADAIFERAASTQTFKFLDNMASLWCEWAEMYLRHGDASRAHELMERAVRGVRARCSSAKRENLNHFHILTFSCFNVSQRQLFHFQSAHPN